MNSQTASIPSVWSDPFTAQLQKLYQLEGARRFRRFTLPDKLEDWEKIRVPLREKIASAMKLHYDHSLPLEFREYGEPVRMDGYSVHKVSYLGAPGRYVSGNLYVPDGKGPFPAVLGVHGHWVQGRLAERVQSRGHVLAKHGFVMLAVDAFGSGERNAEHGKFSFHGHVKGAAISNAGFPLMGIQVTDNMRGVDVLQSLPYVDADRIGVTGASGGGNQTMWLAAMDERLKAAVPVVSVGSFESYLGTENCMCELLPDGLEICEEYAVLALIAPRPLMICNALHDSCASFAVSEMMRSCAETRKIYTAYGVPANLQPRAFNTPHGYWPAVRETMLGFMLKHLRGIGDGEPVPEGDFEVLSERDAMLFEPGKRPADFGTIPDFCRARADEYAAALMETKTLSAAAKREALKAVLKMPETIAAPELVNVTGEERGWCKATLSLRFPIGEMLYPVLFRQPARGVKNLLVLADSKSKNTLCTSKILADAAASGTAILLFDPADTGEQAAALWEGLPSHHLLSRLAQWMGTTLCGRWTCEYLAVASAASLFFGKSFQPKKVTFGGTGDAAFAALFAAALTGDASAACENACVTFDFYENGHEPDPDFISSAVCVPGILEWGDMTLAAALAQGDVTLISPRHADGRELTPDEVAFFRDCVTGLKKKM